MYKYHCLNPISPGGTGWIYKRLRHNSKTQKSRCDPGKKCGNARDEIPATDSEAIARAGAGVNNIPLRNCAEKGIVVFNTLEPNANGKGNGNRRYASCFQRIS